jgi:hypothetical protein
MGSTSSFTPGIASNRLSSPRRVKCDPYATLKVQ